MAKIQDLKFLSLDGLKVVVDKIKGIITTEAAKAPIDTFSATHTDTNATLTVKQAGYDEKTLTINAAGETAGLMSKADKAKLDGIASGAQVNVIEGIVVRAEGDTDSAIAMTTLVDGKKLVIDNLGEISVNVPADSTAALKDKKLAPTAKAVRDYVAKVQTSLGSDISGLTTRMTQAEVDIDQLGTDLAAEASARETADNSLQEAIDAINNASTGILVTAKAYTDTEVSKEKQRALGIEAGLQDAINDINDASTGILATAKAYADSKVTAEASARETADNNIIADLDKVEAFLGTLSDNNSKAANVYNKTEANKAIDDAVAALETKLLGGDREQINDAYETLKGIAEWIAKDETGASALTARVEQNEKDIDALENKDTEILNTIGAGYSATNTVAAAITALQNTLTNEITRSTEKDAELNNAITNEASRAEAAEKKIADDLAQEVTDREAADKTLQDNIDALSLLLTNKDNDVNKRIDELKYVSLINNLACDNSGNLSVTYAVNNDSAKIISFGSLIQETDIEALFA